MAGSVHDLGGEVDGAPPDSWEVADLDAAVSRLLLHSKRESNNSSPNLTTSSSSEFTSASSAPVRSSSGGLLEDLVNSVDQFLREALQNPRERLSVLRMEQDVEKFIKDPSRQQMEFQQIPTSYLRLAAHRIAQHYFLQSIALPDNNILESPGSRIIIHKTSGTRLPLIRLADIPVKVPVDDSTNNVKVAIKQRPNKKSQIVGTNANSQRSNSLKSVEERKEDYNRARARIFSSSSSTSGGKQESDSRLQEVFHHGSVGVLKAEEVSYSTGTNMNSGRGSVTGSTSRIRLDEPISRSRNNSKVAIFRDHEVERNDPDYDRSYDRYAQRFDPGFGFNGGSYPIQPMYTPVLTYNTEFPQLGSNHTHRAPPVSTEHQPQTLAQHLPGPWVPSSPVGFGYRPPESMGAPYNPNHGSIHYTQYPSQRSGVTYIHPHEHVYQQMAQSQQQSDTSYGLARPR